MPTVRINDVDIYYESHGKGFPLVLAYGLGGNTRMWDGQVDAFAREYRFIVWDPRGHGKSASPLPQEQYGLHISALDLCGLLDQLDIEKAYVGGLSMGAGISAFFAAAHPERVRALLLIDSATASGLPWSAEARAAGQKMIELAETRGMEAVADLAIATSLNLRTQAHSSVGARERLRRMFLELNPTGYANTRRALLKGTFPTELHTALSMPTLVLVGENDPALAAARLTHDRIAGSQLTVLPNAGHLSNLDCPGAFNDAVLTFLRSLE
jgi:pimeloyl-ACP methyl ester carboxylesterase